jgi:hypothetical protein
VKNIPITVGKAVRIDGKKVYNQDQWKRTPGPVGNTIRTVAVYSKYQVAKLRERSLGPGEKVRRLEEGATRPVD